jgi:DNA integrity scanning protein DisA with diadenylate cyclase activity
MRHRAAIGISEHTDSLVVVVSEESGHITVVESGEVKENITPNELRQTLLKEKI